MTVKSNKQENTQLCEAANQIQKILKNGNLVLNKWINSKNEDCLFLCKKEDKPWQGVYIQHLNKSFI
jgi:hypothetical protein